VGDAAERLWGVVAPYVVAEGLELDDLEVLGQGRGTIVRVTIDRQTGEPAGDLGIERIAEVSRGLSRLLDAEDAMADSYTLEVTSPGLERRLRRPHHFAKATGRELKVKTRTAVDGDHHHRGLLEDADAEGFTIDIDGNRRRIAYEDVSSARTIFDWTQAPRPGKHR
jgi:ribosome maturation factor RimP